MLVLNDACDGACNCGDKRDAPDTSGMNVGGARESAPPQGEFPPGAFKLTPEQRVNLKKSKKQAKKHKKQYDLGYRVAFGLVITSAIIASIGAEIVYHGCGFILFGILALIGSKIAMAGLDSVRSIIAQHIVRIEIALGGVEVLNPRDMAHASRGGVKPPVDATGMYL